MKKINIAIDGHSSCGKSTTSKMLAARLKYKYIDTGAMYRAVTYYLLINDIDWHNHSLLSEILEQIEVDFVVNEKGENRTLLNGKEVEAEIRTMKISNVVSEVSTISSIRKKLVQQQQQIAKRKGVVMDGRDIGTVVLPDAELKIFMTASIAARTERRWLELREKGVGLTKEEVQKNLEHRDYIDSSRADSPLKQAKDAILLDNSNLNLEQQLEFIYDLVQEKLK
jgi:cytidylate kinase